MGLLDSLQSLFSYLKGEEEEVEFQPVHNNEEHNNILTHTHSNLKIQSQSQIISNSVESVTVAESNPQSSSSSSSLSSYLVPKSSAAKAAVLSSSLSSSKSSMAAIGSSSSSNSNSKKKVNKVAIAEKLKGYFDLAKKEIDKGVRAEEWGLPAEALPYYTNAQAILAEALALRAGAASNSLSESEEIKLYEKKILKWQGTVSERLQEIKRRTGLSANKTETSIRSKVPKSGSATKRGNTPAQRVANVSKHSGSNIPITKRSNANNVIPRTNVNNVIPRTNANSNHSVRPSNSQVKHTDGIDSQLLQIIESTIVDRSPSVRWDDIAGLSKAKQALHEMVILPTKRKDLFTGLRKPARGLLLFGPPGNGKTMLAKAVASEADATFFSVAASSLTSKWVGEAEKLMRTLFSVAAERQPSVIFIDEVDSIMSARSTNENEASRRLKSEFLIQFDGVLSNPDDHVIIMGATNLPMDLDDAVLRRFVKRIYVPLPDADVRRALFKNRLKGQSFSLPGADLEKLVNETDGYSGSDLQALCEEAAMMPIRELGSQIDSVHANQVRTLCLSDFIEAMKVIRPSVPQKKLHDLELWNEQFGSR